MAWYMATFLGTSEPRTASYFGQNFFTGYVIYAYQSNWCHIIHFWNQRKKLLSGISHMHRNSILKNVILSKNGQNDWARIFKRMQHEKATPDFKIFIFIFFTKSWTFRKTYLELPLLRFGHSNPILNRILSNFVVRKRFFQFFATKVLIKLISIIHRWIRLEKSYRMVYHMYQKVYLRST